MGASNRNFCKQALALKTPRQASMSAIGIFRQLPFFLRPFFGQLSVISKLPTETTAVLGVDVAQSIPVSIAVMTCATVR
jgi:hypothetical protein